MIASGTIVKGRFIWSIKVSNTCLSVVNSYCSLNVSIVKGHKHFEEETGKTIFKGKVPKFGEAMLTFYAPNKTSYVIPCQTWFLQQPKNRVR